MTKNERLVLATLWLFALVFNVVAFCLATAGWAIALHTVLIIFAFAAFCYHIREYFNE